jgi:hypothetical protein
LPELREPVSPKVVCRCSYEKVPRPVRETLRLVSRLNAASAILVFTKTQPFSNLLSLLLPEKYLLTLDGFNVNLKVTTSSSWEAKISTLRNHFRGSDKLDFWAFQIPYLKVAFPLCLEVQFYFLFPLAPVIYLVAGAIDARHLCAEVRKMLREMEFTAIDAPWELTLEV